MREVSGDDTRLRCILTNTRVVEWLVDEHDMVRGVAEELPSREVGVDIQHRSVPRIH